MDLREIIKSDRENVEVVQGLYAAFGRGDVPEILKVLADDVEWHVTGPKETTYAGRWRGKAEVESWFGIVGRSIEIQAFEPREFIAQHDKVVVMGFERMRIRATGRVAESPWVMVFQLRDGKITEFFEFDDTAAVAAAFRVS